MTREGALIVTLAGVVVVLLLLVWAWRRRSRRDAGLTAPVGTPPEGAAELARFGVLYVATTRHDEPLERLAIRHLGFRARGEVTVTDGGVAVDLDGAPGLFLAGARLAAVDQATVAIDRVVESGGLTRLVWQLDDGTPVDSYFRPQEASAQALATAIRPLVPPTGDDT
ncbi:hypothetical protein V6S02_06325 [Microbacterium sp. CCNWLW134]|uniref:PH-like domain-containing protein n=1 Tax=Microbacterium sp. CCNWLW134 TaxID=3122064 RepID=UPI00300FA623